MALLYKDLQYTAADGKNTPRRRRWVATRWGHKSYTGVRGSIRLTSRQSVETMLVDQSTREKDRRATRLLRVAGDRYEVHVRVGGHGTCWVEGVRTGW